MSILAQIQNTDIAHAVTGNQSFLEPIKQFILDHFGQNGLYAAYILVAGILALLIYKLVKFGFEIVFLLIIPSVAMAFILTFVLPYSFVTMLPATATLFTLGLIFKSVVFSRNS